MAGKTPTVSIIRTKLQRPLVVGDPVHCSQLLERLDQRRQRPLTLITAPAGYGKSTLMSCWLEADLWRTRQTAIQFLELALDHNLPANTADARYFLGIVHYDRNELDAAEEQLRPVVDNPYLYPIHNFAHSAFPLSLICQAQGRFEETREISRLTSKVVFEQRNTLFRQIADAFQAELDLRQGRIAEADQWARQFKPDELYSLQRFFVPELT